MRRYTRGHAAKLNPVCARSPEIEACRKSGRPQQKGWDEELDPNGINWTNMACQLNSLLRVNRLWRQEHVKKKYAAVLFIRPDNLYNCPFPVQNLLDIQVRVSLNAAQPTGMPGPSVGMSRNDMRARIHLCVYSPVIGTSSLDNKCFPT